jgi:hypothetical protein
MGNTADIAEQRVLVPTGLFRESVGESQPAQKPSQLSSALALAGVLSALLQRASSVAGLVRARWAAWPI